MRTDSNKLTNFTALMLPVHVRTTWIAQFPTVFWETQPNVCSPQK